MTETWFIVLKQTPQGWKQLKGTAHYPTLARATEIMINWASYYLERGVNLSVAELVQTIGSVEV